jgi:hypothetical protein
MQATVPRALGGAFLVVIVTSLIGGLLLKSAVGSGGTADILTGAADESALLRAAVVFDLITSIGIVALAVLLYVVLATQSRVVALVALGLWLLEAAFMAIGTLGALALVPLGQAFVQAGAPASSYHLTLGDFLYEGISQTGYTIHMFFYCAGGLLWYWLFYRSEYVPRAISLFGIAAVMVAGAGIVAELFGADVPMVVYIPLLPFELAIGLWLLVRGIPTGTVVAPPRPSASTVGPGIAGTPVRPA